MLTVGETFSHYKIISAIGAGGMGEVYLGEDTRLDRKVAIKVLPVDLSNDEDRLRRFEQEAKATSALNHPNILTVYDIGEHDGSPFIVAELLEGEELRQRLDEGPVPLRKVTEYAQQIVSGLSAAHEKGIVHRDLKPENLFITRDDRVKILDFGLAKLRETSTNIHGSEDATRRAMTGPGVVMGTVGYMSPEQVRGQMTDHRSDIFSFGLILYEMITGRRAFQEESLAETMSAIVKEEPPEVSESNPNISPSLERIVRRCLEKKPDRRFQSTSDLGFALESASAPINSSGHSTLAGSTISEVPGDQSPKWMSKWAVTMLAVATIGLAVLAGWLLMRPSAAASPPTHLSIALPDGHNIVSGPSISRDGRRIAFVSTDGVASPQLYVRSLNEADSRLLAGTEEASNPFFSPDGQWIAYYAKNRLAIVRTDGGTPIQLTASTSNAGGTWTDDGKIIYKKTWNGGLDVIPETGGESKPLIPIEASDDYAYAWPAAFNQGKQVLFASWGKTFNLVTFDTKTLAKSPAVRSLWRRFAYLPPGYVVGANDGGELSGFKLEDPNQKLVTVLKDVDPGSNSGDARFDLSYTGTLVYVRKGRSNRSLAMVDSQGAPSPTSISSGDEDLVRLSPDGRRAAVVSNLRINIVDLERGTTTPLLPELGAQGAQERPVWSHDGRTIIFASNHEGNWEIYSKAATGSGNILPIYRAVIDQYPLSYASDGTLLFENISPQNGTELWMLPPGGEAKPWLSNGALNTDGRFSPDGRTVAYASNSSGRSETYLQSRDNPLDRIQVSSAGGSMPVWSPSGTEVFFRQGNVIMQSTVRKEGGLSATVPIRLFDGGWALAQWYRFDVMPDGKRFLMVQQPRDSIQNHIDVVLNWVPILKEALGER